MTLETIEGSLTDIIHKVDLATVQTASQITTQRRDNGSLRNQSFWTADSALYRVESGRPVLYLGKGDTNLIFRNPTEAIDQIRKTGIYRPSKEEIESIDAKTVTRFELLDLSLSNTFRGNTELEKEFAYFNIKPSTVSYDLNKTQRALAEHIYGTGEELVNNIQRLNFQDMPIATYVLNPTYVKENAKDSAFVRVCRLGSNFGGFSANSRDVNNPDFALRAVPKSIAKGDK